MGGDRSSSASVVLTLRVRFWTTVRILNYGSFLRCTGEPCLRSPHTECEDYRDPVKKRSSASEDAERGLTAWKNRPVEGCGSSGAEQVSRPRLRARLIRHAARAA